jgi:hypothetical protein
MTAPLRYVFGSTLAPKVQAECLRMFVHRYTRQHKPSWTARYDVAAFPNGYPVQYDSDADWLAHTEFAVTTAGQLDKRAHHCQSHPTWPDNPELRK